jgi:hypothetical protein
MKYQRLLICVFLASGCTPSTKSIANDPVKPQATGPEKEPTGPSGTKPEPTDPTPRITIQDPDGVGYERFFDNVLQQEVSWSLTSDKEVVWIPVGTGYSQYFADAECKVPLYQHAKAGCGDETPPKLITRYSYADNSREFLGVWGQLEGVYSVDKPITPTEIYAVYDGCEPAGVSVGTRKWSTLKNESMDAFATSKVEFRRDEALGFSVPVILNQAGAPFTSDFFGMLEDHKAAGGCWVNGAGVCELSGVVDQSPAYSDDTCTTIVERAVETYFGEPEFLRTPDQKIYKTTVERVFEGYYDSSDDVCEASGTDFYALSLGAEVSHRSVPVSKVQRGEVQQHFAEVAGVKTSIGHYFNDQGCSTHVDNTGVPRCVTGLGSSSSRYTDPTCAPSSQVARFRDAGLTLGRDTCGRRTLQTLTTTKVAEGTKLYFDYGSGCEEIGTAGEEDPYFTLGGPADLTKYPRMK